MTAPCLGQKAAYGRPFFLARAGKSGGPLRVCLRSDGLRRPSHKDQRSVTDPIALRNPPLLEINGRRGTVPTSTSLATRGLAMIGPG